MPPQFFKDAHSVLNNKFVPRSFSLNLNGKNGQNNSMDGSNDSQSFEISGNSSLTPRATSTAPSTGSSSRYFGAYPGGKDHINKDNEENSFENSSMNNFENLVKSVGGSKEKNNVVHLSRSATEGSDDLEITGVREVSVQKNEGKQDQPHDVLSTEPVEALNPVDEYKDYEAAETSADLIMEALVKSQRLCGQYKQRLAQAESKLFTQEDEIDNAKKAIESLKISVKASKDHLSLLESKSKALHDNKINEKSMFNDVKKEIKMLVDEVEQNKSESISLKKKLEYLKQIKLSCGYEVEKKNKEIGYFQDRLDETSGLLSEQKIKCSELEKKLETCRKDYDLALSSAMKNNENSQKELKSDLIKFKDDVLHNIRMNESLKLSEKSLTEKYQTLEKSSTQVSNNLNTISDYMKPKLNKLNFDQAFVNSVCTQILDTFKLSVVDIQKSYSNTMEINTDCKDVLNSIEAIGKQMKENSVTADIIEKLNESNKILEKEAISFRAELGKLEIENGRLRAESSALEEKLQVIRAERDEAFRKLDHLTTSNERYTTEADQKLAKCKTTCESKLRAQMETHKLITEERDRLKLEKDLNDKKLNELKRELDQLRSSILDKDHQIHSIQFKYNKDKKSSKLVETQFNSFKSENSRLCSEIDAQLNTNASPIQLPNPILKSNSQESVNDLELTASFDRVTKDPQEVESQKKKTAISKYTKRKKLIDNSDAETIFDDFDFDLSEKVPALPKRYTKRKKTTG